MREDLICPNCRNPVRQVYQGAYYCNSCDTYSTFEEVEKEREQKKRETIDYCIIQVKPNYPESKKVPINF